MYRLTTCTHGKPRAFTTAVGDTVRSARGTCAGQREPLSAYRRQERSVAEGVGLSKSWRVYLASWTGGGTWSSSSSSSTVGRGAEGARPQEQGWREAAVGSTFTRCIHHTQLRPSAARAAAAAAATRQDVAMETGDGEGWDGRETREWGVASGSGRVVLS